MTFQFRGTHPCGYEGSGYGANRAAYNKIQLDSQFSQRVAGELLFRQPQGHVNIVTFCRRVVAYRAGGH